MALPQTVRVKLSSEVAEAISITPVVLQELPCANWSSTCSASPERMSRASARCCCAAPWRSAPRDSAGRAGMSIAKASASCWRVFPDADSAGLRRAAGCIRATLRRRPPPHRDPARGRCAAIFVSAEDLLGPADGSGRRLRPGLFGYSYRDRADRYLRQFTPAETDASAPPPPRCATARSATRSEAWFRASGVVRHAVNRSVGRTKAPNAHTFSAEPWNSGKNCGAGF